ncbi:MAG: 4Fe-4S binding protein [Candidatus Hodarchaeales archaeon]
MVSSIIQINSEICVGCAYCAMVCPVNCFEVKGISKYKQQCCIKCYKCIRSCPVGAIDSQWTE